MAKNRFNETGAGGFPLNPIVWFAFLGAVATLVIAAVNSENLIFAILSNVITLIASSLFAYKLTHDSERRKFLAEKNRLGTSSVRRVNTLSDELLSLSEEIQNIDDYEELQRIVTFTLRNLEQNARLSVRDIEDIAEIEPKVVDNEAKDGATGEASNRAIAQFACTSCGYVNSANLAIHPGATKQVSCVSCRNSMNIHRVSDGGVKVVDPLLKRLSNQAIKAPASGLENGEFRCPRCANKIGYSAAQSNSTLSRVCFKCTANVIYDVRRDLAIIDDTRHPIYVDLAGLDECRNCKSAIPEETRKDGNGHDFRLCTNCQAIYFDSDHEKIAYDVSCPGGCSSNITFRIPRAEITGMKYCLDCLCRVEYNAELAEAKVIEHLNVPKIEFERFDANGRPCPHCDAPTKGRTTFNASAQRVSICWECHEVFELISAPHVSESADS